MNLEKNWKKISLIFIVIIAIGAAIFLITQTEIISETYELQVEVEDQTGGTVEITPEKEGYQEREQVTLIANPDGNWRFKEWTGDVEIIEKQRIAVLMDSDKEITAHFEKIERSFFNTSIISPERGEVLGKGEETEIIYSIENTGEAEGTQTVELKINEETIDSREHTLQPGETQQNTFTWTPREKALNKKPRIETQNTVFPTKVNVQDYPDPEDYPDPKTPEEVSKAYVWAINHGLFEEALQYLTGQRKEYVENLIQTEEDKMLMARSSIIANHSIEILDSEIDEEAGEATLKVNITTQDCPVIEDPEHEDPMFETTKRNYHLIEEQEEWKIEKIVEIE